MRDFCAGPGPQTPPSCRSIPLYDMHMRETVFVGYGDIGLLCRGSMPHMSGWVECGASRPTPSDDVTRAAFGVMDGQS